MSADSRCQDRYDSWRYQIDLYVEGRKDVEGYEQAIASARSDEELARLATAKQEAVKKRDDAWEMAQRVWHDMNTRDSERKLPRPDDCPDQWYRIEKEYYGRGKTPDKPFPTYAPYDAAPFHGPGGDPKRSGRTIRLRVPQPDENAMPKEAGYEIAEGADYICSHGPKESPHLEKRLTVGSLDRVGSVGRGAPGTRVGSRHGRARRGPGRREVHGQPTDPRARPAPDARRDHPEKSRAVELLRWEHARDGGRGPRGLHGVHGALLTVEWPTDK